MIANSTLVDFLRKRSECSGIINHLKTIYRPYICPFVELLEIIIPSKKTFDIGCGNGTFLSLVAEFRNPSALAGIDISDTLIDNAELLLNIPSFDKPVFLTKYDGRIIPDEIKNYDFIFLIDVLHHIPPAEQLSLITQIYKKMKPGSKFIVKDIDANQWLLTRFNKIHDLLLSGQLGNEITSEECKTMIESSGFSIVQFFYKRMFWYPHYTIIAEKK